MKDFSDVDEVCQISSSFCLPQSFQLEHGVKIQFHLKKNQQKCIVFHTVQDWHYQGHLYKVLLPLVCSGREVREESLQSGGMDTYLGN